MYIVYECVYICLHIIHAWYRFLTPAKRPLYFESSPPWHIAWHIFGIRSDIISLHCLPTFPLWQLSSILFDILLDTYPPIPSELLCDKYSDAIGHPVSKTVAFYPTFWHATWHSIQHSLHCLAFLSGISSGSCATRTGRKLAIAGLVGWWVGGLVIGWLVGWLVGWEGKPKFNSNWIVILWGLINIRWDFWVKSSWIRRSGGMRSGNKRIKNPCY